MRLLLFITASLFSTVIIGQYDLLGVVKNSLGEELEGASVFVVASQEHADVTDQEGWFELKDIKEDSIALKVTYIGYADYEKTIDLRENSYLDITLSGSIYSLDDINIIANKLESRSPFCYTSRDREEIGIKNLAQDLPFLVEHTPSMVVTSDAGAGVGYTGLRIRGTAATRINVTINGVPLNDSESHGVFWVNLPDLGSSVDDLQIQRGVGPSTNGSGAFGATVNLQTNAINQNPYVKMEGSYGSFNTYKGNISLSTGLMNNKYLIEGRYSLIHSDGYIDRAGSDLKSWYLSAAKIGENHSLRFNAFSGKEITFQAWNGVPQARLNGTPEELMTHYLNNSNGDYNTVADSTNLFDSDRRYNTYLYANQVDDYKQDHFQFHYAVEPSNGFKFNATAHYTKGFGFFEEYKHDQDLEFYTISDSIVKRSDLIRIRALDNDFYGLILGTEFKPLDNLELQLGGGWNRYEGGHFGNVLGVVDLPINSFVRYYESDGFKEDLNGYGRVNYSLDNGLSVFADMQHRSIVYNSSGLDSDRTSFVIDTSYSFFNPKLGLSYQLDERSMVYASYARAHREPVRSDFLDAIGTSVPQVERLDDIEVGFRGMIRSFGLDANVYYMKYKDQLALTGDVNDVGAPVRTNVDDSHRLGLELAASYQFSERLTWRPNLTLSQNKISAFTETILDGTNWPSIDTVFIDHQDTDIAFSPSIIGGSELQYTLDSGLSFTLLSKFVGKQFLDNTSDTERSLDAYFTSDLVASYKLDMELIQGIEFKLLVNNIFNTSYSSNGYTYSYIVGDLITENYLYPQAGMNFLLSGSVTF